VFPPEPETRRQNCVAMNALIPPRIVGSTLSTLTVTNRWFIAAPGMTWTGAFAAVSHRKPMSSSIAVMSTV